MLYSVQQTFDMLSICVQRWFRFAPRVHGVYDKSWDRERAVSAWSRSGIPSSNNWR